MISSGISRIIKSTGKVEKGITLTLAPKSTRALSKQKQGKVKLPVSFSFRGMALLICEAPQASVNFVDMAYWLDPIRRIEFESALMKVEIDLTWSLGFVSVELGRLPNPLSCSTLIICPI
ncbi:hypothetical protein Tco_0708470 [Tanacetum coccineum]